MATSSRPLCRTISQLLESIPSKRKCLSRPVSQYHVLPYPRQFATSRRIRANGEGAAPFDGQFLRPSADVAKDLRNQGYSEEDVVAAVAHHRQLARRLANPSQWQTPKGADAATADDMEQDERALFDTMSPEDQQKYLGHINTIAADLEDTIPSEAAMTAALGQSAYHSAQNDLEIPYARADPRELGYWGDDEDDELGKVEDDDDDWDPSMMTSVAESELELNREVREYMRVAAWDMPLLNKFAKPFAAPTHATPLRFRYTTYMGEFHPAQKKVVVEFSTKDLQKTISFSEPQRIKLIKLVGVRYNPSTDTVRMSCEKFEHAAQNKRYLGDLINKLIAEAKDPADMFEDIPLDFRHHKEKKKPQFPEEWKLTQRRVEELEILRQGSLKQLAAAEEAQQAELTGQSEQQRRIQEYALALPLGRRENNQANSFPGDH